MHTKEKLMQGLRASYQEIGRPRRVGIALSGGADSCALLLLMEALAREEGFALVCIHVHHGLRDSADSDQAFACTLSKELNLPYLVRYLEWNKPDISEEMARKGRYEALFQMKEEAGCEVIALAHHLEDQAETLLMHLLRGAGGKGLRGMAQFERNLWRPLLAVSKETLLLLLEEENQAYCTDETNLLPHYTRNALRLQVMPSLRQLYPKCDQALYRAAVLQRDQYALSQMAVSAWMEKHAGIFYGYAVLDKAAFLQAEYSLQRAAIHKAAEKLGFILEFEQTEQTRLAALKDGGKTNLPKGGSLQGGKHRLLMLSGKAMKAPPLTLEEVPPFSGFGNGISHQALDRDKAGDYALRPARKGDIIRPLGLGGSQSVDKYLADRYVEAPLRKLWPVLAKGNQALWLPGFSIGEDAAVDSSTQNIVYLQLTGTLPDGRILGRKEP